MAFRWPLGGIGHISSRGLIRSIPRLPPPPTPLAPPIPSRTAGATGRAARPEMHWRGRRIPDWIARPLMPDSLYGPQSGLGYDPVVRSEHQTPDGAPENTREVEALQIVVLISMPSPERAQALRLREGLWEVGRRESGSSGKSRAEVEVSSRGMTGECVLGSARVNWQGEIDGSV